LKSNNFKRIGYLSSQAETKFESKKKKLISLSEIENQPMDDGYIEEDENNYVENNEESDNDIISNDNQIYEATDQDAEFPGGNPSQFVASRFNPDAAVDVEGKIIVRFVVEKDGSISNIDVVRGLSPEANREAIRVVSSMPRWKSGKNSGKSVRSRFSLPIVIQ
jgi:protein TonB